MSARILLLTIFLFILIGPVMARDGDFIKSWGDNGRLLIFDEEVKNGVPAITHIRPDHSLIAVTQCWEFTVPGSLTGICVWKRLPDGTLDTGFGEGVSRIRLNGSTALWPSAIATTPAGKIVVAADFSGSSDLYYAKLWRLRPDGSQDYWAAWPATYTFHFNSAVAEPRSYVSDIVSYDNDHVLVAGIARNKSGSYDLAFAKVDQAYVGFDQSFGQGGVTLIPMATSDFRLRTILLQPNGGILFAGSIGQPGSFPAAQRALVGRLTSNGQLDKSFANEGIYIHPQSIDYNEFMSIDVDRSGRILATGDYSFHLNGNYNSYYRVARFLPDGTPDTAFGPEGERVFGSDLLPNGEDSSFVVRVLNDNRMLVAGQSAIPNPDGGRLVVNSLVRLRSNGDLDDTFGQNGFVYRVFNPEAPSEPLFQMFPRSLSVSPNEIVMGGEIYEKDPAFMKLVWESLFQNGFD